MPAALIAPQSRRAGPFLKWAGGKGQLLEQLGPLVPAFRRYFEPFLGGGAMFFALRPERAVLSDSNPNLIACFRAVREAVEDLIPWLERYREQHGEAFFYRVRTHFNEGICSGPVERAAQLIYLNKTGYNGLYRENSRGGFNVPFGRYHHPQLFDPDALRAAAAALARADVRCRAFESCLEDARRGDFVYFDPPYQPLSDTARFTSYTRHPFGEREQRRLAAVYRELDRRGCRVMLSNSDTPLVRELYQGFDLRPVQAARSINCVGASRGRIQELAVLNYPS